MANLAYFNNALADPCSRPFSSLVGLGNNEGVTGSSLFSNSFSVALAAEK